MPPQRPLPSPLLIIVLGLPGTGKTTFAKALGKAIQALHFNTDIIREKLGLRGHYDKASKEKVYHELEQRAHTALQEGRRVIVDGTFYRPALRQPYRKIMEQGNIPGAWIKITADGATVEERVSQKREHSEAGIEVYREIRKEWEPLEGKHLSLPSGNLDKMVEQAIAYLERQTARYE